MLFFQQMLNAVAENLVEFIDVAARIFTGVEQNAVDCQFVADIDGTGKVCMHTEIVRFADCTSGVVHLRKNPFFFKIFYGLQIQISVCNGSLKNAVIQSRVHAGIGQQLQRRIINQDWTGNHFFADVDKFLKVSIPENCKIQLTSPFDKFGINILKSIKSFGQFHISLNKNSILTQISRVRCLRAKYNKRKIGFCNIRRIDIVWFYFTAVSGYLCRIVELICDIQIISRQIFHMSW